MRSFPTEKPLAQSPKGAAGGHRPFVRVKLPVGKVTVTALPEITVEPYGLVAPEKVRVTQGSRGIEAAAGLNTVFPGPPPTDQPFPLAAKPSPLSPSSPNSCRKNTGTLSNRRKVLQRNRIFGIS